MFRQLEGKIMNEPYAQAPLNYVTCPCQHCSGKIEFDANQIDVTGSATNTLTGQTIACPHCGLDTILFVPQTPKKVSNSLPNNKTISLPEISNTSLPLNLIGWSLTKDLKKVQSWVLNHKVWSILFVLFIIAAIFGGTSDLLNRNNGVLRLVVEGCLNFVVGLFVLAVVLFIYFLPYYFARKHGKKNKEAIFILNLFLGWTFVGWVVAAVWAYTKDDK